MMDDFAILLRPIATGALFKEATAKRIRAAINTRSERKMKGSA
jgi:hypothetical protein